MIKKIIKYGTVAAVSITIDRMIKRAETYKHPLNRDNYPNDEEESTDDWEGEYREVDIPYKRAQEYIITISSLSAAGYFKDREVMGKDLRDINDKIMDSVEESSLDRPDTITISIHGRQRLHMIEGIMSDQYHRKDLQLTE